MAAVVFVIGPCPNPGCTRFHGVTATKRPASRSGADDLTAAGGRAREDIGVGPGLRPLGVTRSVPVVPSSAPVQLTLAPRPAHATER